MLRRLVFFLISLFTNKNRETLVKEILQRRLKNRINARHSGLIDFYHSTFRQAMSAELNSLKEGLAFFRDPLAQTMGKERSGFIAFLTGFLLKDTQDHLNMEFEKFSLDGESNIIEEELSRKQMLDKFESVIKEITAEEKRKVYLDAIALHCLYTLSAFPIDVILSHFRKSERREGFECEFPPVTKNLVRLSELLQAAHFPPSADALRAVFLFTFMDRFDDEEFDIEDQINEALLGVESALNKVRNFNDNVPLITIIRYISQDINFAPKKLGGGEDWFVIFREFWRDRIDRIYRQILARKKQSRLAEDAQSLMGFERLPELSMPHTGSIRYQFTLSLIKGFVSNVNRKINKALRVVLAKGEFYKEQNRRDFADAVSFIDQLADRLPSLENRLSRDGDLVQRSVKTFTK